MPRLSESRIDEIEEKAEALLADAYGSMEALPPIDVGKIVTYCGLKVVAAKLTDANISGVFIPSEKTIYVNELDGYERRAWTVAHELGHWNLHNGSGRPFPGEAYVKTYSDDISEEEKHIESEASWFAANLLMPREYVERYSRLTNSRQELAEVFGVSKSTMVSRLKGLRRTEAIHSVPA